MNRSEIKQWLEWAADQHLAGKHDALKVMHPDVRSFTVEPELEHLDSVPDGTTIAHARGRLVFVAELNNGAEITTVRYPDRQGSYRPVDPCADGHDEMALIAVESREHLGVICRRCHRGRVKAGAEVIDIEAVEVRTSEETLT